MTPDQVMADSLIVEAYTDLARVEKFESMLALWLLISAFFLWMMAIGSKDRFNIRTMFLVLTLAAGLWYIQLAQYYKASRATAVYAAEKITTLQAKHHQDLR